MPRPIPLVLAIITGLLPSFGQVGESIDRNADLLRLLDDCIEGYSETVEGEMIQYPRLTQTYPVALLTRATTGAMAIEWRAHPVPVSLREPQVTFVVSAGLYGQEDAGRKFRMSVNGVPRFTFAATTAGSWQVNGESGGALMFDSVLRDQHSDYFGYLRITIPAGWLDAGHPPRFRVVGEKAGSPAWFMVFRDPEVLQGLREKVKHEAWCRVQVVSREQHHDVTVTASSNWVGRRMGWVAGGTKGINVSLVRRGGHAAASFEIESERSQPLRILLDGETIAELKGMAGGMDESRIFPRRLVSVRTRSTPGGGWVLEYQSTYMPELGTSLIQLSEDGRGSGSLRLINSSHQDIAWMDSPARCVEDRDVKVITPALALLEKNPGYRYDLEDVLELREYLERHPDRKNQIHRLAEAGRLGIGASFTMPYEDLCSGEMLVRQFYAGRRWFMKNFPGCDTHTAWNPDVPGRSAQSLQIMKKAGVQNLVISRHERGLYDWRSPDGSGVLVFSPHHYALYSERTSGKSFPEAAAYLASFVRDWRSGIPNGGTTVPILVMSDMSAPVLHDGFLRTWNGLSSLTEEGGKTRELSLPPLRYSTAEEYFDGARKERSSLRVIQGERPNIWLYIHGPTHHRAISAKREADVLLTSAEIFCTVDALLSQSFTRYPQTQLTEAWESQLYPDHGWGGKNGETTDSLFLAKYERAREIAGVLGVRAMESIAARVRTPAANGVPLVVFNALSRPRSAAIRTVVSFPEGMVRQGFTLRSARGKSVPLQVLSAERHGDGSLKSAEIVFVATEVPSVGYATFYAKPSRGGLKVAATSGAAPAILESSFFDITLGEGGIRQITDKEIGCDLLKGGGFLGGEVFTMQSVGEDAGEWAVPQMPTMEGFDRLSNHRPRWQLVETGPVRQVVEMRQPMGNTLVVQRVLLYHRLKQIDIETSLLSWDGTKYREFRLAIPVNMQEAQVAYEVPFAALEVGKDEIAGAAGERYTQATAAVRPRSIQNWISVSDRQVGVTMSSSVAVWDYEDPTSVSPGGLLLQPVLLASRRSCHGEGNWYLQEGDHHYRFSLTSHAPGWRNGWKFGTEANTPFVVVFNPRKTAQGTLPEQMSFLSLDADNVALSTLKKGEDGDNVIVRLVEMEGRPAQVALKFFRPIRNADTTDILELGGGPLAVHGDRLSVPLGHHAIATIRVVPESAAVR